MSANKKKRGKLRRNRSSADQNEDAPDRYAERVVAEWSEEIAFACASSAGKDIAIVIWVPEDKLTTHYRTKVGALLVRKGFPTDVLEKAPDGEVHIIIAVGPHRTLIGRCSSAGHGPRPVRGIVLEDGRQRLDAILSLVRQHRNN